MAYNSRSRENLKPGYNPNAGRPKGAKNKLKEVQEIFIETFEEMGGREAFIEWAKDKPTVFYQLLYKMFPKEPEKDEENQGSTIKLAYPDPTPEKYGLTDEEGELLAEFILYRRKEIEAGRKVAPLSKLLGGEKAGEAEAGGNGGANRQ